MDNTWQLETAVETCSKRHDTDGCCGARRRPADMSLSLCVFSVFSLDFLDELVKIEAHDSEVLCLAFSPTATGKTSGQRSSRAQRLQLQLVNHTL